MRVEGELLDTLLLGPGGVVINKQLTLQELFGIDGMGQMREAIQQLVGEVNNHELYLKTPLRAIACQAHLTMEALRDIEEDKRGDERICVMTDDCC